MLASVVKMLDNIGMEHGANVLINDDLMKIPGGWAKFTDVILSHRP